MFRTMIAAACLMGGTAWAHDDPQIVDATDPARLVPIVAAYGSAELTTDANGDPMIDASVGDLRYAIFFDDCTDNVDCAGLTFTTGWEWDGVTPEQIDAWNESRRYLTAYLDDEGDPIVRMSVNLFGGVTPTNLSDTVDWWQVMTSGFITYLDEQTAGE